MTKYWELDFQALGMKPRDSWHMRYRFKKKPNALALQKAFQKYGEHIVDNAGFDCFIEEKDEHDFDDDSTVESLFWGAVTDSAGLDKKEEWIEDCPVAKTWTFEDCQPVFPEEEKEETKKEEKEDENSSQASSFCCQKCTPRADCGCCPLEESSPEEAKEKEEEPAKTPPTMNDHQ